MKDVNYSPIQIRVRRSGGKLSSYSNGDSFPAVAGFGAPHVAIMGFPWLKNLSSNQSDPPHFPYWPSGPPLLAKKDAYIHWVVVCTYKNGTKIAIFKTHFLHFVLTFHFLLGETKFILYGHTTSNHSLLQFCVDFTFSLLSRQAVFLWYIYWITWIYSTFKSYFRIVCYEFKNPYTLLDLLTPQSHFFLWQKTGLKSQA